MTVPCEHRDEAGRCRKREQTTWEGKKIRPPCEAEDFPYKLEIIEREMVCQKSSLWGDFKFLITEEQIEALRAGKVLCLAGEEYGYFIAMEGAE